MPDNIAALVTAYDNGTLTRRQLLHALAIVTAPAAAAQTPSGSAMRGRLLHHVNVQVSDVSRSEAFYRTLLGLPPSRVVQGPDNHGLDLPAGGLIILQRSARQDVSITSVSVWRTGTRIGSAWRHEPPASKVCRARRATISSSLIPTVFAFNCRRSTGRHNGRMPRQTRPKPFASCLDNAEQRGVTHRRNGVGVRPRARFPRCQR
jgi:Glyoxalase/Bleomycin resistance protein/Dioxygenase superfamily